MRLGVLPVTAGAATGRSEAEPAVKRPRLETGTAGRGAADPVRTAALVRMLEDLGCESVWTVEHVVVPGSYRPVYPYDPGGRMSLRP